MGLFRRKSVVDDVMSSINRSAVLLSAPHDPALWAEAERRAGHVSLKAISDEYERLAYEKYRPRGFFERLFGV
jgi:hypothetical protein